MGDITETCSKEQLNDLRELNALDVSILNVLDVNN